MSLNSVLSTSLSGLFTSQEAIRATSNNIANVNTEGYNRNIVVQDTRVLQGAASGVEVVEVRRIVDEFLETSFRTATSNTEEFSIQRSFHDRLQGFLGDPASESSLSARTDRVFERITEVALSPADVLRRQSALAEIDSFLLQINTLGNQIQSLRAEASQQIVESVGRANEALNRIFEINPLLVRETTIGGETGGLEQQLATELNNLAEEIDIRVVREDNGDVSVFTSNGTPLVNRSLLHQFAYTSPGAVTSETVFPIIEINRVDPETLNPIGTPADFPQNLRSGTMRGLLDLRDGNLADLTETLGELAARTRDSFNAVHNSYTAVPAPNSLTGEAQPISGDNSVGFSGITTFAVVNSDNTTDTSVTVDFTAQTINGAANAAAFANFTSLVAAINTGLGTAGTLSFTDGVMAFSASDATDGVLIHDDETTPARRAGRGFSHFFGMNDLIKSASTGIFEPGIAASDNHNLGNGQTISFSVRDSVGRELSAVTLTIDTTTNQTYGQLATALSDTTTGLGNFFTFAVDPNTGALTSTITPPRENITLSVQSDNTQIGTTGISLGRAFGLTQGIRESAARDLQVRGDITTNPNLMSLASFDTTATGTVPSLAAGDQRGALALQALQTQQVSFSNAGEQVASDVTIPQYVARFLGNAGTIAERVSNLESDNRALQFEVSQRQSDFSGVNLDEELANLVVYQNAYGAAARVLTSVQELYDSLLAAV